MKLLILKQVSKSNARLTHTHKNKILNKYIVLIFIEAIARLLYLR